jgi:hypothetical protein
MAHNLINIMPRLRNFMMFCCLVCHSSIAMACLPDPSYVPMPTEEAMRSAQMMFVGVVTDIDPGSRKVTYEVVKAIKGVNDGERLTIKLVQTPQCIGEGEGEVWLRLATADEGAKVEDPGKRAGIELEILRKNAADADAVNQGFMLADSFGKVVNAELAEKVKKDFGFAPGNLQK